MNLQREYLIAEMIFIGVTHEVPFGVRYRNLVGYRGFNRYINRV